MEKGEVRGVGQDQDWGVRFSQGDPACRATIVDRVKAKLGT